MAYSGGYGGCGGFSNCHLGMQSPLGRAAPIKVKCIMLRGGVEKSYLQGNISAKGIIAITAKSVLAY
jgi:hypothetical protein